MNKAFEKILDGIESLKSNKGFGGTISVKVTVKDGKISAIDVSAQSGLL